MFTRAQDQVFMDRCLAIARQGLGWVSPNPLVGALVVQDGRVIGEGFHRQAGLRHAEVAALAACVHEPDRATLYVNLEPCDHEDKKTPPCTRAIIKSGIRRVVVGISDPNPKVSGRGIARLRAAGLHVAVGVQPEDCTALNRVFTHWITTGNPYVAAKVAISRDYKITAAPGVRTAITGPLAQRKAHELRQTYDAILVGVGTVIADDPELSVRFYPNRPRDPRRIILDGKLQLPIAAKVLRDNNVLVATTVAADPSKRAALQQAGIPILETSASDGQVNPVRNSSGAFPPRADQPWAENPAGIILKCNPAADPVRNIVSNGAEQRGIISNGVNIPEVLAWCAKNSITSVLVEGGRKVLDRFQAAGLIQRWHVFVGPNELGPTGLDALADLSPLQRCVASKPAEMFGSDAYFACDTNEE